MIMIKNKNDVKLNFLNFIRKLFFLKKKIFLFTKSSFQQKKYKKCVNNERKEEK